MRKAPRFMNARQKLMNIPPKFTNLRQKFMNIGPVIAGKVAIFAHFWSPIRKSAEKAPFSGRFSRSIRFSDKDGFFGPPRNDPVFPKGARTPVTDFRKERKDGAAPDAFSKPA